MVMRSDTPEDTRRKFFERFKVLDNGCWQWKGQIVKGHGRMRFEAKNIYANRYSYLIFKGLVPRNVFVLNTCGETLCVNPEHLYLDLSAHKLEHKEKIFMLNVEKKEGGCWLWKGLRDRDGYGIFCFNKRQYRAHRQSYEIFKEDFAKEKIIMHVCDNPPCVNPDHLNEGTIEDNNRDMAEKGRCSIRRGEKSPVAKFSNRQVKFIRTLYELGLKQCKIAKIYFVHPSTVSDIINNKTYA